MGNGGIRTQEGKLPEHEASETHGCLGTPPDEAEPSWEHARPLPREETNRHSTQLRNSYTFGMFTEQMGASQTLDEAKRDGGTET